MKDKNIDVKRIYTHKYSFYGHFFTFHGIIVYICTFMWYCNYSSMLMHEQIWGTTKGDIYNKIPLKAQANIGSKCLDPKIDCKHSITFLKLLSDAAEVIGFIERDPNTRIIISGEIGTHTLRKTFGYHAYQNGTSLELLMDIYNLI